MGVIIKIFIGLFLFSIFGGFVNDIIYYILFSWSYFFNIIFFLFSLFGLSGTGYFIINLVYYLPSILLLWFITKKFTVS